MMTKTVMTTATEATEAITGTISLFLSFTSLHEPGEQGCGFG